MSGLGLRSPAFVGRLTASGGGSTVPSAPVLTGAFNYNEEGSDIYNLSWTTPANGGSTITGFTLQYSFNGSDYFTESTGSITFTTYSPATVENTTVYFRVFATNAIGNGPVSNVYTASRGATAPSAPVLSGINLGDDGDGGEIHALSWTVPANNGSAITGYRVQYSFDNSTWDTQVTLSSSTTTYNANGATNFTYYFRVFAINAIGNGAVSNVYVTI